MNSKGGQMKVAIDIDGTINASKESVEFFKVLTCLLIAEHKIYILTNREPNTEQEIADELDCFGIEYSEIVITPNKAEYIKQHNITIFFENSDLYFLELGPEITVFKIRESENFDFDKHVWIGSYKTTRMIDEKDR